LEQIDLGLRNFPGLLHLTLQVSIGALVVLAFLLSHDRAFLGLLQTSPGVPEFSLHGLNQSLTLAEFANIRLLLLGVETGL
jgi:hypothetical protein